MVQTELAIENSKLEKSRAYARERMQARRDADPEGEREKLRAWKAANPEKVKLHRAGKKDYPKKYKNIDDYVERRLESARRWRTKNPGYKAAWKAANPEKARAYYENNTEKVRSQVKRAALQRLYGLTLEQRDELFAMQGHQCAVCKSTEPGTSKNWHTDHCHDTGRVRGILCNHCNLMLGYAKDNAATLANAIEYLRGAS